MVFSLDKQDTAVLKGIAICSMLFHHLYAVSPPLNSNLNDVEGLLRWLGELGKVCVAIFLFCSGYGMSVQFDKASQMSFLSSAKIVFKRLLKFYLGYWVVFIVFVPITIFVFNRPLSLSYGTNVNIVKRFVYDFFGIQGFHSYNVTWWFNLLILIFYLASPVLCWLSKRCGTLLLLLCLALLRLKNVIPGNYIDK